ncbi:ACBP-domain-containing protein [Mycena sanguinolenta]|uniref:ACBP-domain-containing protein n=1 Tax=Mycena sanguinolenta TaxID=230812 RepID=A0A8H6Y6B5_9AGAR|nr:ACBP-domain-containing protein [Mycena sanguinolenta]
MSSHELIDAQFDRAVEIVQGLPKTGPIQTGYDEKLAILYKQATVGNVTSPRPGLWDMLGRAKWYGRVEQEKHHALNSFKGRLGKTQRLGPIRSKMALCGHTDEGASHSSVSLHHLDLQLQVLRKYSDRTVSADLIQELESYGGDPSNIVMSRRLSGSGQSDSSGSTASDEAPPAPQYVQGRQVPRTQVQEPDTSEDETDEEAHHEVIPTHTPIPMPQINRPASSVSSHRYRTPMAGSLVTSPPPVLNRVPETQPMPGFETPSAFGEPSNSSSFFPSSYVGQFSESYRAELTSPPNLYPMHPQYRGQVQPISQRPYDGPSPRPGSRPTIEHAIQNMQAHLAALSERIESLESMPGRLSRSRISASPRVAGSPRGSPTYNRHPPEWDLEDLGMWSLVANPVARGIEALREAATFFARDENRSPTAMVVRRLVLDTSFLLCVLAVIRLIWKKSGVRRREVNAALIALWRAIIGKKTPRIMVDRGV